MSYLGDYMTSQTLHGLVSITDGTMTIQDGFISSVSGLDMNGNLINNVASGISLTDAVNKGQLDTKLNLTGGTLSGVLNMGTNSITSSFTAVGNTDIPNKLYVDNGDNARLKLDGTTEMTGDLNMGTTTKKRIINMANAIAANDAVNKSQLDLKADATYVDSQDILRLKLDGTTEMTGNLNMGATTKKRIINMADGSGLNDAVNKSQLDTKLNLIGGTMTGSIDMAANKISSTFVAIATNDIPNKLYVDNGDNARLKLDGTTEMTGNLNMGATTNKKIINMADGSGVNDAVNKGQLDGKLNLTGGTLTGVLNMGANKITSTYTPLADADVVNKLFTNTEDNLRLKRDGTTEMTGDLNMGTTTKKRIINMADGSGVNDAVNKSQLDTKLNLIGGTMTGSIDMVANKISSTFVAIATNDIPNKLYVDNQDILRLKLDGTTEMTGNLNMGATTNKKIINMANGVDSKDAVNKGQLDGKLNLSGGTLSGDLTIGTNRIYCTAVPFYNTELVNKLYFDTINGLNLLKTGGTLTGVLNMGDGTTNNKITNLDNGTAANDAVNKVQLDTKLNLIGGTLTGVLNMGTNAITSSFTAVGNTDIPNKLYVDGGDNLRLKLDGTTVMTGDLNMGTTTKKRIINMADGSGVNDAVNKGQLDGKLNLTGGTLTGNLDMVANKISSTFVAIATNDIPNKLYVDNGDNARLKLDGTNEMTGNLNMGTTTNKKIINMANGTTSNDAVNKSQLDGKLNLTGGTLTGNLDMGANKITSTYIPLADADVVNKLFTNTEDNLRLKRDGTTEMTGDLNMGTTTKKRIINMADGSGVNDAVNKGQLDGKLNLTGGTLTGVLNMGTNAITSSFTAVGNTDLPNKLYVDAADNLRVLKGGDTMTGTILIDKVGTNVYTTTSTGLSIVISNTQTIYDIYNMTTTGNIVITLPSVGGTDSSMVNRTIYVNRPNTTLVDYKGTNLLALTINTLNYYTPNYYAGAYYDLTQPIIIITGLATIGNYTVQSSANYPGLLPVFNASDYQLTLKSNNTSNLNHYTQFSGIKFTHGTVDTGFLKVESTDMAHDNSSLVIQVKQNNSVITPLTINKTINNFLPLNMNSNKIINLASGIDASDAINKSQLDLKADTTTVNNTYIRKDGGNVADSSLYIVGTPSLSQNGFRMHYNTTGADNSTYLDTRGNTFNIRMDAAGTGTTTRLTLNGLTMDVKTQRIINIVDPLNAQDAATKNYVNTQYASKANITYVDTQDALKLNKAGDTMTGDLSVTGAITKMVYNSGEVIQSKFWNNGNSSTNNATILDNNIQDWATLSFTTKSNNSTICLFADGAGTMSGYGTDTWTIRVIENMGTDNQKFEKAQYDYYNSAAAGGLRSVTALFPVMAVWNSTTLGSRTIKIQIDLRNIAVTQDDTLTMSGYFTIRVDEIQN